MEHITAEYYRAGTPYLSPEALEEIIQSRGTVKNASKKMADKYYTSTRRIYEIWKRHAQDAVTSSLYEIEKLGGISGAKKETIPPVISQETEDVLELHKRNQKEIEKIRASGRILASKLS
ncbi:2222_t:CDS:2, partial [Entrophospora sp. SA101]